MTSPANSWPDPPGRWRALLWLAAATFLAMSTWFSASAVLAQLGSEWRLSSQQGALLTIAVQLGFVAGAVISAALNLPDLVPPRRLLFSGALGAALANAGLVWCTGASTGLVLRFATGGCLALVYPSSLKELATWFRAQRGTALGVQVGALTLGSALPHLLNAFGGVSWRAVILATSALTVAGGALALAGREGPFPFPRASFDPRQTWQVFHNRGVRLASFGYFGHMWELYAMWAWFGAFFADALAARSAGQARELASLAAFAAIGAGAAGCWLGGVLGDRFGRARTNASMLLLSGACALLIGWTGWPLWVVGALGIVWGASVVADSAQFSTLVTEMAEQSYVGTAVTLQLALGFSLTVLTIWLVPMLRDSFGWHAAFASLAAGPAVGILSMLRLVPLERLLRR
jgi:MFS family permease